MTQEEFKNADNIMSQASRIIRILKLIDGELGMNPMLIYNLNQKMLAKTMLFAMFYDRDATREIDTILRTDEFFTDAVNNFGKKVTHNNKTLPEICRLYQDEGIVAFADNELFENLINAREKFLIELKKTFEELLKSIPTPEFPEKA